MLIKFECHLGAIVVTSGGGTKSRRKCIDFSHKKKTHGWSWRVLADGPFLTNHTVQKGLLIKFERHLGAIVVTSGGGPKSWRKCIDLSNEKATRGSSWRVLAQGPFFPIIVLIKRGCVSTSSAILGPAFLPRAAPRNHGVNSMGSPMIPLSVDT